ncbi:MAG TPA: hypothetical protein DCE44_17375 [Verrucomicrobiales bacterium]|nr:hypothetical protein [Verrucomicrobiales bacterium]
MGLFPKPPSKSLHFSAARGGLGNRACNALWISGSKEPEPEEGVAAGGRCDNQEFSGVAVTWA